MIDYFASFKNPIIEENNDRNAHNEHFNKNMYIVLFNKICKRLSLSRYKAWGGGIHSIFQWFFLGRFYFNSLYNYFVLPLSFLH